jgi:class 3 adenylate cyclase
VLAAVRFVVEAERRHGELQATATDAAALPAGVVTIMMTDIEGSTGLLHHLGDRYRDLLSDVRAIQRDAIARAAGREIDARGDEFFAVFERAADAVRAATTLQRTLQERSWPDRLQVRIRVGLHTGQPTLTDVGYIGLAVHTAARVCSAAHGGQIVVSGDTRTAVKETPPEGVAFRSLGRHQLHGLPQPEALFQVRAQGLIDRFPGPRTGRRARPRRPAEPPPPAATP